MINVLLFASGIGNRWTAGYPKQLALVEGIPVIRRTVNQLIARGITPTLITFDTDIVDAVDGLTEVYYSPPSTKWSNTFLGSEELWKGRTLPFHADVVWDPHALDIVLGSTGLHFFGTLKGPWENFAISFDPEHYDDMRKAAQAALRSRPAKDARCGTWEVYRSLVGIPLGEDRRFENKVRVELKTSPWSDYTYDFDKMSRYEEFMKHNPWARSEK